MNNTPIKIINRKRAIRNNPKNKTRTLNNRSIGRVKNKFLPHWEEAIDDCAKNRFDEMFLEQTVKLCNKL